MQIDLHREREREPWKAFLRASASATAEKFSGTTRVAIFSVKLFLLINKNKCSVFFLLVFTTYLYKNSHNL